MAEVLPVGAGLLLARAHPAVYGRVYLMVNGICHAQQNIAADCHGW